MLNIVVLGLMNATNGCVQVRCELMSGFVEYLRHRCRQLDRAELAVTAVWLTHVDRQLTGRGWQVLPFLGPSSIVFVFMLACQVMDCIGLPGQVVLGPSSIVFVFMLARQVVRADVSDVDELRTVLLACLYVTYSYIGCEISYPVKVGLNCPQSTYILKPCS